MIPYGQHSVSDQDVNRVTEILQNHRLTQGDQVAGFEDDLADSFGAEHAVALNNGTTALYLAYRAHGIDENSVVITVPNTFVATANAALMTGAEVRFVDINYQTGCIDVEKLRRCLQSSSIDSPDNIWIVPVHFAGLPCSMQKIQSLAHDYGARVIEDACHAPGGRYRTDEGWSKVGACDHSEAAVFSFHPVKHFTTGEGGAVLTNSKAVADKIRHLRHHGIRKEVTEPSEGPWFYEMDELGVNGRITDFQCALGRSQLARLDDILKARREIADTYDQSLANIDGVEPIHQPEGKRHAYHLYVVRSSRRDDLFEYLQENGVSPQVHYIPVPSQPYYRDNYDEDPSGYPAANKHYERSLSLPIYPDLKESEQEKVISLIKSFFKGRS